MKFTDGYWGLRKGVRLFSPAQALESSGTWSLLSLTVYAPAGPSATAATP